MQLKAEVVIISNIIVKRLVRRIERVAEEYAGGCRVSARGT
jgi:hypothetical protein